MCLLAPSAVGGNLGGSLGFRANCLRKEGTWDCQKIYDVPYFHVLLRFYDHIFTPLHPCVRKWMCIMIIESISWHFIVDVFHVIHSMFIYWCLSCLVLYWYYVVDVLNVNWSFDGRSSGPYYTRKTKQNSIGPRRKIKVKFFLIKTSNLGCLIVAISFHISTFTEL